MTGPARQPWPVEWVAGPPGRPGRHVPRRVAGYTGPPGYRFPPRWGFPRLAWRPARQVPGGISTPERSGRTLLRSARFAGPALLAVAVSGALAGGGELFRYALLVIGRTATLPRALVAASDSRVVSGAVLGLFAWLFAAIFALRWLLIARTVAADLAGVRPARPDWAVLLGILLPVINLFQVGPVLAELEHTARQAAGRVTPSRLVAAFWLVFAANEVVAVTTILWRLRTGIQAQSDGVLWHAAVDLLAVAVAVLAMRVVDSVTGALVAPASDLRGLRVVDVTDAPAPDLRPSRPAGSRR
jgi:hypothetical protein